VVKDVVNQGDKCYHCSTLIRILRNPAAFAAAVMVAYFLAILPVLIYRDFDFSVFIVAGDKYVNADEVASPIIVRTNSWGYDGQFYYRLALAPLSLEQRAFGVAFDEPPAWRMQRIVYPLIAWAISLDRPAWVPASLVFTNLIGLWTIAFFASRITMQLRLDNYVALLIVLWPGFIVTLTHDTTEIISVAFLFAALSFYFAGNILWFGFFGLLATLTRETGILCLAGIFCFEAVLFWQAGFTRERLRRVLICGAAMIPYVIWHWAQQLLWGESSASGTAYNLGWPFVGPLEMLRDMVTFARYSPEARSNFSPQARYWLVTSFDGFGILSLLMFCALGVWRASAIREADSSFKALVFGWLPIFALMMSLSASGPWVGPTAYFRAFTECFVVGSLILFWRPYPKWLLPLAFVVLALLWIGALGQNTAREFMTLTDL
jgi:hypothetical protein